MTASWVIRIENIGSRGTEYAKIFNDKEMNIIAHFTNENDADTAKRIIERMRNDSAFVSATVEKSGV